MIDFCVLIKHPTKFEDILTLLSIQIGNDIEFLKNLQLSSGLTDVPRVHNVRLKQVKDLSLLFYIFYETLAKWFPQKMQIPKVFTFLWNYRKLILCLQNDQGYKDERSFRLIGVF